MTDEEITIFDTILQKMIGVEQEVYFLFLDLAKLETKNLQDSEEYQAKLEILQDKIEEESFYFSPKVLDIEWLLELSEFFEDDIKPEYFDPELTEMDIERIYIRAYQLLEHAIEANVLEDQIQVLLPQNKEINIKNVIKYVFPAKRTLYKQYYEMIFMQKAMNYSLNDRLYNIQEAIENEKDIYTKQELQTIKYLIAFCDSPFMPSITKILADGPFTKIIHEQIEEEISSLKANKFDFLHFIDNLMFEDANDFIDDLLSLEYNLAGKKALLEQLKATLSYLSKPNLELINEIFNDEKQQTIINIEIKEILTNELENRSYHNVGKSEVKPNIDLELTDERIELIKNILNIEHSIYQIYEQIIKYQIEPKEKESELKDWIENLKDAHEIEQKYLKQIKLDYEDVLQFSLAFNADNLHLYSKEPIDKIELLNIKSRVNGYIEPLFNDLLMKELLNINSKSYIKDLKKEKQDEALINFLQRSFHLETYKKVNTEIKTNTGNIQKELISDQFGTIFTNYHLTDTLIDANFNCEKLPIINEDYLYIISLELGIDYDYLYQKFNIFMYESALQFGEYVKNLGDEEGDYSTGYRKFLEAQVKAALPFLSDEQLKELGYKRQKILVK